MGTLGPYTVKGRGSFSPCTFIRPFHVDSDPRLQQYVTTHTLYDTTITTNVWRMKI